MNALETDIIRLRALEPEDVDILYKWENDTNIWKVSNTVAPFSRYILRQFIENQKYDIYETRQMRLIIESKQSGKPVGSIDIFDIDPYNQRAGVGILIYDKEDQGQGYASSALSALVRYAFHILCFNQLYCNILSNNTRSLNLFKSKGFTVVGLKREWVKTTTDWLDEYMLQLINPIK
ncbi:MAG: GNAT family N-acetyltransferase [Tidjanibacter sp.]|nr:GNAT family N-acetyltransferase [Tidjanibacter sp.]